MKIQTEPFATAAKPIGEIIEHRELSFSACSQNGPIKLGESQSIAIKIQISQRTHHFFPILLLVAFRLCLYLLLIGLRQNHLSNQLQQAQAGPIRDWIGLDRIRGDAIEIQCDQVGNPSVRMLRQLRQNQFGSGEGEIGIARQVNGTRRYQLRVELSQNALKRILRRRAK